MPNRRVRLFRRNVKVQPQNWLIKYIGMYNTLKVGIMDMDN